MILGFSRSRGASPGALAPGRACVLPALCVPWRRTVTSRGQAEWPGLNGPDRKGHGRMARAEWPGAKDGTMTCHT